MEEYYLIYFMFLINLGYIYYFFSKQEYEAKVKVFIGKQKFINVAETYDNAEITLYQRLITTYSEIAKSKKLVSKSINDSKVNYLSDRDGKITYLSIISNFTVNPITDTQIIEIKYSSLNPQQSYDLLYSMTENIIAYSKELYPTVNIKVVEQVHVDYSDLISKNIMIVGAALILGLLTGIGIVIALMYFDNTFKNKRVLEEEIWIPVIGVIPDFEG